MVDSFENVEVYKWFKEQGYQTDHDEWHEYEMIFLIDLPKILRDWEEYREMKGAL